MSHLEKPFLTVDQQIKKLEARRLRIHNVEKAKMQILRTSYYDLIKGYKEMFLLKEEPDRKEDQFIEGTTFEDIVELYQLDRRIRFMWHGFFILISGSGNADVYADFKYKQQNWKIKIIKLQKSPYNSLNELERQTTQSYNAYHHGYNKTRGNK